MRPLVLSLLIASLLPSPAHADPPVLNVHGAGGAEDGIDWFFESASDRRMEFSLRFTFVDRPCYPMYGTLIIEGHEDAVLDGVSILYVTRIRDVHLTIRDHTGELVLLEAEAENLRLHMFGEFSGYEFVGTMKTTMRRDLRRDCSWSPPIDQPRVIRFYTGISAYYTEITGEVLSIGGQLEGAFLTAVANEEFSWGALKAEFQ